MNKGKVKWFDSKKGYGFIKMENGTDVFIHHTGISMDGFRRLEEGQTVEFDVMDGDKGKMAMNVTVVADDEVIEL